MYVNVFIFRGFLAFKFLSCSSMYLCVLRVSCSSFSRFLAFSKKELRIPCKRPLILAYFGKNNHLANLRNRGLDLRWNSDRETIALRRNSCQDVRKPGVPKLSLSAPKLCFSRLRRQKKRVLRSGLYPKSQYSLCKGSSSDELILMSGPVFSEAMPSQDL